VCISVDVKNTSARGIDPLFKSMPFTWHWLELPSKEYIKSLNKKLGRHHFKSKAIHYLLIEIDQMTRKIRNAFDANASEQQKALSRLHEVQSDNSA